MRVAKRFILPAIVILALAALYNFAVAFGVNLWMLPGKAPEWWIPDAAKIFRYLSWLHINTTIGIALVSFPFALCIAYFKKSLPIRYAFVVILVYLLTGPLLYVPFSWEEHRWEMYATWSADVVKQAFTLPFLTFFVTKFVRRGTSPRSAEEVLSSDR